MSETIIFMVDETLVAQHDYYGCLNTILTKKSQFYSRIARPDATQLAAKLP
jgi:hypothetical protein